MAAAADDGEAEQELASNGCCEDEASLPDSAMETGEEDDLESEVGSQMRQSSSLQLMLCSIAQQRERDGPRHRLMTDDDTGFVLVARDSFWTDLFQRHFIDAAVDEHKDDMLFYVRKTIAKSKLQIPQTEIEVFRKSSTKLPSYDDPEIDWEETVYLNLILQHFEYQVTCAICSRTGEKELQILKKFTQKVYASPSKRQMDGKGTGEEMTYPNIFFTVDNFEECFSDIVVRDSEMVCVELLARDRNSPFQGVIFLGSIRYDALRRVYDARASLSHRMAQRMSLGWFKNHKRVEFVRMRGPQAKGHAEMAVSRVKGSGPETPVQTPDTENFRVEDFNDQEEDPFARRRMSDPSSQGFNKLLRGSFKRNVRKSHSAAEDVDYMGSDCQEVEANDIEDEFNEDVARMNGFIGKSFGQAWHWFKDRRRANCVALHAYLTYITLPWHRIIADITEEQGPLLRSLLAGAAEGTKCRM